MGVHVSRFAKPKEPPVSGGTPIWIMVVYALGLLAGAIIVLSLAFSGVVYASGDSEFDVNVPAFVLWGVIVAVAAGVLVWRRRGGGR
jgi:hypothetical protein